VSAALANFSAEPQQRRLPTAPAQPIVLHTAQDRPQPRLDVAFGGGMPVHTGRVRRCPVLGYKLVAMGHNVVRGAAGAALLNAELMVARLRSAGIEADRELESVTAVRDVEVHKA
jgi:aspartate-semialdehyde dehydrogenase